MKVFSQTEPSWFFPTIFLECCIIFIIHLKTRRADVMQSNEWHTLFRRNAQERRNGLLIFKCWKKHCGRCYLLTSRHTVNTSSVVCHQARTKRVYFHLISWHTTTEQSERFHKVTQKVHVFSNSERLFHITVAQLQNIEKRSATCSCTTHSITEQAQNKDRSSETQNHNAMSSTLCDWFSQIRDL